MKALVFVAHFYILKKMWMNNLITPSFRRTHKFFFPERFSGKVWHHCIYSEPSMGCCKNNSHRIRPFNFIFSFKKLRSVKKNSRLGQAPKSQRMIQAPALCCCLTAAGILIPLACPFRHAQWLSDLSQSAPLYEAHQARKIFDPDV